MTFFPKTLSASIQREVGDKAQNYGALVQTLSVKNLLTFFQQATQHREWCHTHSLLVSNLFIFITDKLIAKTLPWSEGIEACSYLFKYSAIGVEATFGDFFLLDKDESQAKRYSRLVMMRGCPSFRKWWMEHPNLKVVHLETFSSLQDLKEFDILYQTFINDDFSACRNASMIILQNLLLQSIDWNYERGIIELQKIICTQLLDYTSVIGEYEFAVRRNLSILKEHCLKVLENIEFSISKLPNTNYDCYTAYTVLIHNDSLNKVKSRQEIINLSKSYLEHYGSTAVFEVNGMRLDIVFVEASSVVIGLRNLHGSPEVEGARYEVQHNPKGKIDRNGLKKLVVDGSASGIPDVIVVGILAYYEAIQSVDFNYYSKISDALLQRLDDLKPNLTELRFYECLDLNEKVLLKVTTLFSNLKILHLSDATITRETLTKILEMPSLRGISFRFCSIYLPNDKSLFSRFHKLHLEDINTISCDELVCLFQECEDMSHLCAVRLSNFNLRTFPNPVKLVELTVDSAELEKYVETVEDIASIPILDKFTSLKVLNIQGTPSPRLKPVVLSLMKAKKIQVIFHKIV